jgi:SAM-dependent methyltransferase
MVEGVCSAPNDAFTDRSYHKVAPVPSTDRPSIYELRQPARDWYADFFDRVEPMPAHGRVLDAGSGAGFWVPTTRARLAGDGVLVALDLNHSRLRRLDPTDAVCVTGDVVALPFPDGVFDVVLAMHMLYHVPDITSAVRELRRVLRPGTGVLYALTNSDHAQWEMTELYLRHGGDDEMAMDDARFSNESGGALLRTAFAEDDVELREQRDSELVVTDVECIIDEFQRLRYTLEPGLRADTKWDDMIAGVRSDARAVIDRDGAFRISENHGLFTCRRRTR